MWHFGRPMSQTAVARQGEQLIAETKRRLAGTRPRAALRPVYHLGTLSWRRAIADQTELTRPSELQRRFDPKCFYRDANNREQHSGKWSPIVRGERRPSPAILKLVEDQLPGTTDAFEDPLVQFAHGNFTEHLLLRVLSYLAVKHLPVLGAPGAEAPYPAVREKLTKSHLDYLISQGTTEALTLTTAYLVLASFRRAEPGYVRFLAECTYRQLLAMSLELFRRGIAHDVFEAYRFRIFRNINVGGKRPAVDPRVWSDEVALFNVLPYAVFKGPATRDWATRQRQLARIALGQTRAELYDAFKLWWFPASDEPTTLEQQKEICAVDIQRLTARATIRDRVTPLFSKPTRWADASDANSPS